MCKKCCPWVLRNTCYAKRMKERLNMSLNLWLICNYGTNQDKLENYRGLHSWNQFLQQKIVFKIDNVSIYAIDKIIEVSKFMKEVASNVIKCHIIICLQILFTASFKWCTTEHVSNLVTPACVFMLDLENRIR